MRIPWKGLAAAGAVAVLCLLALAVTATIGWRLFLFGPRARPLTDRRFERTPERLERGRFLVERRYSCFGCHSPRDWSRPGAPSVAALEGAGSNWAEEGMPWLTAPNLTPDAETGAGRWSDDALARALREGIGHDGRTLFPIMPYQGYRFIPDEDVAAIVVYLRSLAPIRHELPPTRIPFPLSFLVRTAPAPLDGPVAPPDLSTAEARGRFLLHTVGCRDCHTPMVRGERVAKLEMAGGFRLHSPKGDAAAANLTPDPSGIPYYDEALFIEVLRTGKVKGRELSPTMPWVFFGRMSDEDLKDIFAYLKTLPPVSHHVDNLEAPTPCKRCGGSHGRGRENAPL